MNREERAIRNFERVRQSGVTNMLDRDMVCTLADITPEEHLECIKNYDKLIKKYNIKRD